MIRLFFVLVFFAAAHANAQPKPDTGRIDSILTYLHQRHLFNGVVLIGEKGKVVYKKVFDAPAGVNTPLTPASAFNLASISKQFYAMMVMMLHEQGNVNYDDAVQKFLPTFPYPGITVRHLLNQVSGLPEYFDLAMREMGPMDTLTNASMLKILADKKPPLVFSPGERWEYSNTNYTTLASVIEAVAGIPCDKFFERYIAKPLKLTNTYIYTLTMKSHPPSRVFGFRWEGSRQIPNDLVRLDGVMGDGNFYSSADDLFKWEQALYTEKLVKRATLTEAFTPGKLNNGQPTHYGFAWFVDTPTSMWHTGGWVGFTNLIARKVEKHQTLIVLDNSSNPWAVAILKDIWNGKTPKIPHTELITNVRVIAGNGLPAVAQDVRIVNARIHEVGKLPAFAHEKITDGKGRVLAPGFIDSHSHHDRNLREQPACISAISQGITTIVVGQDGDSDPVDSIRHLLTTRPLSLNVATYTGHASLRERAMGNDLYRRATSSEIDTMKAVLTRELKKGSLGLSTGLEYEAAFYGNTDEVIELARTTAQHGGRYISHIRSEDMHLDEAIEEIIQVGREAKLPVQISHIKIAMRSKWGTARSVLSRLQQARAEGINITADVYPYTMWMSTPRVLFPKKDFTNEASAIFATQELFDPATSVLLRFSANPSYENKTISDIAAMHNESPARALMRVVREAEVNNGSQGIAGNSMSEKDIVSFLQWPHTNVCSDGAPGGHPRGHGAFTRVLGAYIREQHIMPLETAIYKMTGLTAEHLGLSERGVILPGNFADLVLFDPDTVRDNATINNPTQRSTGIDKVWVNGKVVYENQQATGVYSGTFVH